MASNTEPDDQNRVTNPKIPLTLSEFHPPLGSSSHKVQKNIHDWAMIVSVLESCEPPREVFDWLRALHYKWSTEGDDANVMAALSRQIHTLKIRATTDDWMVNHFCQPFPTLSPPPPGFVATPFADICSELPGWLTLLDDFEIRFDKDYDHLEVIHGKMDFERSLFEQHVTEMSRDLQSVSISDGCSTQSTGMQARRRPGKKPVLVEEMEEKE